MRRREAAGAVHAQQQRVGEDGRSRHANEKGAASVAGGGGRRERRRGRRRDLDGGSQWLGDIMNRPWLHTAASRLKVPAASPRGNTTSHHEPL
ncbi:hypothetical protein Dimus_012963, partial [Dionaea muscipula]